MPFGEYLPFQRFLESLGLHAAHQAAPAASSPASAAAPWPCRGAPRMLPFICYEIIFPGERDAATASGRAGSSTSPTTAGSASAPAPISICSRRACARSNEGLPLVRAANTGISAVIDPLGRIAARLPLGAEGVLDAAAARHRADALCADRRLRRGSGHRRRPADDRAAAGSSTLKLIEQTMPTPGLCPGFAY